MSSKTNPARGMRDFLPADVRKRNYVINIIKEVYESYGFEPLETPAVENLETLMGKYGEEGNQLIFRILKRGEKLDLENARSENDLSDLALRYDLTVPLARVVANNKNDLPKFFKRYQIQPVWRADRPARGRFREFYQCDVDAIGSKSVVVEAELIKAVIEILESLGFDDFVVRINHRDLLFALLEVSGIPPDKYDAALVAIDKIDKIGPEGVLKEFASAKITDAEKLIEAFGYMAKGDTLSVGTLLANYLQGHEKGLSALTELDDVLCAIYPTVIKNDGASTELEVQVTQLQSVKIGIDPSLARGLSYYTGTIMEINVPDLAGSLGGGGRYDGLIGMFGKEQIPACGFSLGLERILVVMDERGMFPPEIADSTPADVMVTVWSEDTIAESLKLASELRQSGLRVTVYPEPDKLGKQIKYADSIRVPYVCVLGESEIAEGKVTIKNMKTGEQETVERGEASASLA
ncbi:MAG TPA: histidine--tRNA ligase [Pyrinomonadaceae bacterium]